GVSQSGSSLRDPGREGESERSVARSAAPTAPTQGGSANPRNAKLTCGGFSWSARRALLLAMALDASFPHPPTRARSRSKLCGILTLTFLFFTGPVAAAPQSVASRGNDRPSSKVESPFLEAETLLRKGSIDE